MARKFYRIRIALLLIALAAACTYKPPDDPNARPGKGFNIFPEWYDNMIGEEYGELYVRELPVLHNAPVQRDVDELGAHLVRAYYGAQHPPYNFRFHVVNLDIMNAFALPGGEIFIFRGLMQELNSEAELAGVLSHEMGHVVARHGTKNMSKGVLWSGILAGTAAALAGEDHEKLAAAVFIGGSVAVSLGLMKYSRDYEREADWVAVHNCYRAGYNPEGMISLFEHFKDKEGRPQPRALMFLSTHPSPEERQQNVNLQLPKLQMAREWNSNLFGFTAAVAELKSLPPAPKELDGKPALGFTTLDSLGAAVASQKVNRLKQEYKSTGVQTVKIYVPSNEEWTDTAIDLRAGQHVRFQAEGRRLSSNAGSLKATVRKGETDLQTFSLINAQSMEVEKSGRLFLGVSDDNLYDNEGWYVVTTEIR